MATLLIRDIPESVVGRLKNMARRNKRSLQQELKAVLENTIRQSSPDIFQKVAEIRDKMRKKSLRFTDSAKILREDRRR